MYEQTEYTKSFKNHFESLSMIYGSYNVFEDFLEMFINGFSFNFKKEPDLIVWREKYKLEERHKFGFMIQDFVKIQEEAILKRDWYDFLGLFYEEMSMSKQKGFAQYFTPEHICDFIVQILNPENETLAEPALGSGRFVLAAATKEGKPLRFAYGADLDFTCVKMATINFFLHGIHGVVECLNSLTLKDFRGGFIINSGNYPNIIWEKDRRVIQQYMRMNTKTKSNTHEEIKTNKQEVAILPKEKEKVKYKEGKQLKLFF